MGWMAVALPVVLVTPTPVAGTADRKSSPVSQLVSAQRSTKPDVLCGIPPFSGSDASRSGKSAGQRARGGAAATAAQPLEMRLMNEGRGSPRIRSQRNGLSVRGRRPTTVLAPLGNSAQIVMRRRSRWASKPRFGSATENAAGRSAAVAAVLRRCRAGFAPSRRCRPQVVRTRSSSFTLRKLRQQRSICSIFINCFNPDQGYHPMRLALVAS